MWVFVFMLMIAGALEGQKLATNALELDCAGGCEPPDVGLNWVLWKEQSIGLIIEASLQAVLKVRFSCILPVIILCFWSAACEQASIVHPWCHVLHHVFPTVLVWNLWHHELKNILPLSSSSCHVFWSSQQVTHIIYNGISSWYKWNKSLTLLTS